MRFMAVLLTICEGLPTRLIKIFKMFVESMDRISSNRRNSGIVDFQEAHDEFFGV